MAKQNKFRAALAEAETKLQKAEADLKRFQEKSQNLQFEIPRLRDTVNSLRTLCGKKPDQPKYKMMNVSTNPNDVNMMPIPVVPEEVKKRLPAQNFVGMGSIPAKSGEPTAIEADLEQNPDALLEMQEIADDEVEPK